MALCANVVLDRHRVARHDWGVPVIRRAALLSITAFACGVGGNGEGRARGDEQAQAEPAANDSSSEEPAAGSRTQPTAAEGSNASREGGGVAGAAGPPVEIAPEPAALVPESLDDYVGNHVLVRHGATLRTAAQATAPGAVLRLAERAKGAEPVLTMEVVGREGDWLAVRPALESLGCTGPHAALEDFDLRLWVQPDDLASAVAVPTTVTFDDGTAASVWPGAPASVVDGDAEGIVRVDVGGVALALPADKLRIGPVFRPEPAPDVSGEASVMAKKGPAVRLDGYPLDEVGLLKLDQHPAITMAAPGAKIGRVWTRCAALDVAVDPGRKVMLRAFATDRIWPHLPAKKEGETRWAVSEGTTIYWRGGATTGTVLKQVEFRHEPRRDGKSRECFWVLLTERKAPRVPTKPKGGKDRSRLELCFDSAYVTQLLPELLPSSAVLGTLSTTTVSPALEAAIEEALQDEGLFAEMDGGELDRSFGLAGSGHDEDAGIPAEPEDAPSERP